MQTEEFHAYCRQFSRKAIQQFLADETKDFAGLITEAASQQVTVETKPFGTIGLEFNLSHSTEDAGATSYSFVL